MTAATMPAMTPAKGMVGMLAGRGGGAPGKGPGGGGGGGSSGSGDCGGGGCILLGLFPFYCEDIFCVVFLLISDLVGLKK